MKVSLNWLKNYVTPGITVEKLLDKLTMAGLEVEKSYSSGGDTVFEMEITPNRADCLSVMGVSREAATILNKPLKKPKIKKIGVVAKKCSITVEDKNDCLQYIGTLIESIEVKESPKWLKQNLEAVGLRPINNIVDITNFSLMELGQPLHAFDYDKLAGGKIIVRRAKKGEKLITIDDSEIELDPSVMVIADAEKPVAIAGIMGGKDTEVTKYTKNILLESAAFDPVLIRRTARKIALSSDSSYRFERGIDRALVEQGADRTIGLILECTQGKVTQRANVGAKQKQNVLKISVSIKEINQSLGAELSAQKIKQILKGLECQLDGSAKGLLKITPPGFRPDIKQKVDIVEEIARVVGYDALPMSLPNISAVNIEENSDRKKRESIKRSLLAQGYDEVITFSMINSTLLNKSKQKGVKGVKIRNPLSLDQEIMRPTMLPSMLNIILTNINRGQRNVRFFEIGKVYAGAKEREAVSLIATGQTIDDWRKSGSSPIGFFDIKGAVERLLQNAQVSLDDVEFRPSEYGYFEAGEQVDVFYKGMNIGHFGKVSEEVLIQWQIKNAQILYGQIATEEIYKKVDSPKKYQLLVEYPSVVRDISLAVKKETSFAEVKKVINSLKIKILKEVVFNEEYLGDKIARDQRGLIFSVIYQLANRTLREEEVMQANEQVCQALTDRLGAIRR